MTNFENDTEANSAPIATVGIVSNGNCDSLIAQLEVIESIDYQLIELLFLCFHN